MIKYLYILIISITVFGCQNLDKVPKVKSDGFSLVWQDEFDIDGPPDSTKWSYDLGDACDKPAGCGWGNHELQYYTDRSKNVRVEDGKLIIELHKEKYKTRDFSSARLVSKNKGDWKYGRIEVNAKIPNGLGVWSAIWMLSTEDRYHGWPHSGEIDIMENVGYDPDTIVGTAHTLNYHHSIGTHKTGRTFAPMSRDSFLTYKLEWTADEYTLSVNNKPFFTFKNEHTDFKSWPFDQQFHLIMNIAFGGDWGGAMGVEPEALPAKMEVDYIRVYQNVKNI